LYFAHVSFFGSGVENDSEVGADSGEWDIKNCFFAAGFSAVGRPDRNISLIISSSYASERVTYRAIVRIGAKIAQYCARSAPLPMVPLVDGDTAHELSSGERRGYIRHKIQRPQWRTISPK
jgi:hypothetical protein